MVNIIAVEAPANKTSAYLLVSEIGQKKEPLPGSKQIWEKIGKKTLNAVLVNLSANIGEVHITDAFYFSKRFRAIAHVIVPRIENTSKPTERELHCLKECYKNILAKAIELKFKSVSLPILGLKSRTLDKDIAVDYGISSVLNICKELDTNKIIKTIFFECNKKIFEMFKNTPLLKARSPIEDSPFSITIRLIQEDISKQKNVCAVVNAANNKLQLGSGVAGALRAACGPDLQKECDGFMTKWKSQTKEDIVPTGSLVATKSYNMQSVKAILHVVAPICNTGKPTQLMREQLRRAYDNIFEACQHLKYTSVAICFLGAGIFRYPKKETAEMALLSSLTRSSASSMNEIRLVCLDNEIANYVHKILGNWTVVLNSQQQVNAMIKKLSKSTVKISTHPSNKATIEKCVQLSLRSFINPNTPTKRRSFPLSQPSHRGNDDSSRSSQQAETPAPQGKRRKIDRESNTPKSQEAIERRVLESQTIAAFRASQYSQDVPTAQNLDSQETNQRSVEVQAITRSKDAERMRLSRQAETPAAQENRRRIDRESKAAKSQELRRQNSQRMAAFHASQRSRSRTAAELDGTEDEPQTEQPSQASRSRTEAVHEGTEGEPTTQASSIQATQSRAERAARREAERERPQTEHNEETEQSSQANGNIHPIIDILSRQSRREPETVDERRARLARSRKYRFSNLSRHLPLRKPMSRIITENQKKYNEWIPGFYNLGVIPKCRYCGALTYVGRCCSGGRVHVRLPPQPPQVLAALLKGTNSRSRKFQKAILPYNRAFQMASISCERAFVPRTHPFVKINGSLQFQMAGLRAPTDKRPLFGQIYLFDPKEAAELRLKNPVGRTVLDETILLLLSDWFHENNALAKQLMRIADIVTEEEARGKRMGDVTFVVRAPTNDELEGRHRGTMSRPLKEIPSFLYKTDDTGAAPPKGIWVRYNQGGHMTELAYYDPNTEPALYPLLHPYGEKGFQYGEQELFPRGTTRRQAGFTAEADCWSELDTPTGSNREITPIGNDGEDMDGREADETSGRADGQADENVMDDQDGDSYVSEENEDCHLEYPEGELVPRTAAPVDFDRQSDQEENLFNDIDGEFHGDEAIVADPESAPVAIEEPDDEVNFVQTDVGTDGGPTDLSGVEIKRRCPSRRQNYLYQMQERFKDGDHEDYGMRSNLLGGMTHELSQFALIDQYLRVMRSRSDYMRGSFAEFRGSSIKELSLAYEILQKKAVKAGLNVGYSFRLPRAHPTSVAWYKDQAEKAMVMHNQIGKPDAFVTMTVFFAKCQELLDDIINKELFGPVVGYVYSIEFQKRGMPHMHLLVTLKEGHKLDREQLIEKHVYARFPEVDARSENPTDNELSKIADQKRLVKLVNTHMVHNPCKYDSKAHCQVGPDRDPNVAYKKCTKNFPKEVSEFTKIMPDGTVVYLRPSLRMEMGRNSKEIEIVYLIQNISLFHLVNDTIGFIFIFIFLKLS